MTPDRGDYIAGLRALADLLERDDAFPLPDDRDVAWYLFGVDADGKKLPDAEQKARAADLVRRLPGRQEKQQTGELFRFRGHIGGIRTQVIVDRDAVCERVVTGTREVEEKVPTAFETVTKVVEDVEWVCKPLLADDAAAVTA